MQEDLLLSAWGLDLFAAVQKYISLYSAPQAGVSSRFQAIAWLLFYTEVLSTTIIRVMPDRIFMCSF